MVKLSTNISTSLTIKLSSVYTVALLKLSSPEYETFTLYSPGKIESETVIVSFKGISVNVKFCFSPINVILTVPVTFSLYEKSIVTLSP